MDFGGSRTPHKLGKRQQKNNKNSFESLDDILIFGGKKDTAAGTSRPRPLGRPLGAASEKKSTPDGSKGLSIQSSVRGFARASSRFHDETSHVATGDKDLTMLNTESPERQSKEKRESWKVQRKPFNQSASTKSSDDADAIIDKRMRDGLLFDFCNINEVANQRAFTFTCYKYKEGSV